MKNLYLSLICSLFIIIANAQKNCAIISYKAYATNIIPGTIKVDENGNEIPAFISYSRRIYLTTTCNKAPTITSIMYNKTKAKHKVIAIVKKSIEIGNDNNGRKITLISNKNNFLWEVEINLKDPTILPDEVKIITINGTINKKNLKIILKEENISPLILPV